MHVKRAGMLIRQSHRLLCALLDEKMILAYRMQLRGCFAV